MNENEFELDGKVYVAVQSDGTCSGCALILTSKKTCHSAPACDRVHREDKRNVIFVEKQP